MGTQVDAAATPCLGWGYHSIPVISHILVGSWAATRHTPLRGGAVTPILSDQPHPDGGLVAQ